MRLRPQADLPLIRNTRSLCTALAVLAAFGLVACSESESDKNLTGGALKLQLALGTAGKSLAQSARSGRDDSQLASPAVAVEALKYHINSISICEEMDVSGSGFQNPGGCLSVYEGDLSSYEYDPSASDWTPLADRARMTDVGFIDLMSDASRATLAASTVLTRDHVRSYNYGLINWALPIKVKASVEIPGGATLYSHDGATVIEVVGADQFRSYYTRPNTPLTQGPAEEAVVLLGNGGNWFKFQSPLVISQADIDERRAWVLDLVFNPDGIIKGTSGGLPGQIAERDAMGTFVRGIAVPMLDLAPVPHRTTETVVRESYVGPVSTGADGFDLRVEIYSVDGDPSRTIYGVDIKSLVSPMTTGNVPPVSKVSFVETRAEFVDFLSFSRFPFMTGFRRGSAQGDTTTASIVCATHAENAAAQGGQSAIVIEQCPSPTIEVPFTLVSRTIVVGSTSIGVGGGPDAGTD